MEATAKVTGVRITPRKAKLVVDVVRGKDVSVALGILANTNKSAVDVVTKLIKSAAANAVNNFKMNRESLYIAEITANDAMRLKRILPSLLAISRMPTISLMESPLRSLLRGIRR